MYIYIYDFIMIIKFDNIQLLAWKKKTDFAKNKKACSNFENTIT